MLQYSICAFLAPALVSAAAFPWAGPEPTLLIPEPDAWSPAPTEAPEIGAIELFKRAPEDNTCGFISGNALSSLTCNNPDYVCATNTYYGVHGCCDPSGISTCSIPTTCIPSSQLAASCTGDCSTNDYIAKCTDSNQPYCYEWRYVYDKTIMTEYGCASEAFTLSVQRSISGDANSILPSEAAATDVSSLAVSAADVATTASSKSTGSSSAGVQSATASPTSTTTSDSGGKKSGSIIAPIVGGVVGGLVVVGAVAFGIIFLIMRNKKSKQNDAAGAGQPFIGSGSAGPAGVTEYKPQNGGFYGQDGNYPQGIAFSPQTSPAPLYAGPMPLGVAEAGGNEVQQPQKQPQAYVYEPPQKQPQAHVYEAP